MLSILIPTYNYSITNLISQLHKQLEKSEICFEIICLDDKSRIGITTINEKINVLPHTRHILSNKNNGIAVTRQLLCLEAKYEWVLFLDADIELKNEHFINNYIKNINNGFDFVFGGFDYKKELPSPNNILRWKYGINCEALSAKKRNLNPYKVIIGGNFLAKKDTYKKLNIDTIGNVYAMDYYFGTLLKHAKIKIYHINNQVYHLGIEKSEVYLKKIELAIKTLLSLYNNNKISDHSNDLLNLFNFIKKRKLNFLFLIFYKVFKQLIKKNLLSKTPVIFLLQLYKISYMCYYDYSKD